MNFYKNIFILSEKKSVFAFSAAIAALLLTLSLSIYFKNIAVSQTALAKKNGNALKELSQEFHNLESAYIDKISFLSKDTAAGFGLLEKNRIKFVSRNSGGILVKAEIPR